MTSAASGQPSFRRWPVPTFPRLRPGDHLLIPAGLPHRVLATSDEPRCLWLAVHLRDCAEPPEHRD
jgi:uncharacterized RmlC-like cupin family protein